jgi:hypothetical protein
MSKTKGKKMGRPATTFSRSTPTIQIRVGREERARLEREAKAAGTTIGLLAKARVLGTAAE